MRPAFGVRATLNHPIGQGGWPPEERWPSSVQRPSCATPNAQRSTLNAQRSTLNAQRSTLNAQRSTPN
ncbi:MAG: hypothetical protein M0Q87_12665, partial [Ottowia sp.]|nr:hypothetical protein [Ottowia sp.]